MSQSFTDAIGPRLAIHPAEALYYSGLSDSLSSAHRTARNKIYLGNFPFRLTKIGRRKLVLVTDFLSTLGLAKAPLQHDDKCPPRRGRGRPRKHQQEQLRGSVIKTFVADKTAKRLSASFAVSVHDGD